MIKDLVGQKFGKLKVLNFSYIKKGVSYWNVICDCGNIKTVIGRNLSSGYTKSCGCTITKHKLEGTRFYHIWEGMSKRSKSDLQKYKKHETFNNYTLTGFI